MTKPFITNVSRFDIHTGLHEDAGENSVLIQIIDQSEEFPIPKHKFKETYQFIFDDIYDEDNPEAITDSQAQELAEVLRNTYSKGYNVVCHCHAGLCRSGAVVEAGVFIGFNPPDKVRLPNDLVLRKLYKALGAESTPKRYDFIFREDFVWN